MDELDKAILRELQSDARKSNRDVAAAVGVSPTTALERTRARTIIDSFRRWVAALPDITGVYVTTGTEDFILHVAVPDNNALYALVIDKLTQRPEIADVRTSIVYEHITNTQITPAAD